MTLVPQLPKKVQYLLDFSFPIIDKVYKRKPFVGGRIGYDKKLLFTWLLVKKVTNWDYRTISEMAGVSHPTLIRANKLFLEKDIYKKVMKKLVKEARKTGILYGEKVAIDSSFVKTFSKKRELGSEEWNGHKESYGFKVHVLIDAETQIPIFHAITNGLAHDSTMAIPLLKQGKEMLEDVAYVLGDKGYDSDAIVRYIAKELHAKAAIPINKRRRGRNYNWEGAWRNFRQKAEGRTLKKSIYNKRVSVERLFSSLKRTYHLGKEEMRGILNFAKNCYLSLIAYLLKKLWIMGITKI